MFPGQGSQKKGMGGELFDQFQDLTAQADEILGYSIKELCLQDPKNQLGKTQFTQPALYVANALAYYQKINDTGEKPDFVIGHSLGEFNALLAAECFDFATGLKLVQKRGQLMSQVSGGSMAAVVNASKQEIESILKQNNLTDIDLANFNTAAQIVLSGKEEQIHRAEAFFQYGEVQYHLLRTSGAFHSRYMDESKKQFAAYAKAFTFADLQIPVIANVTAKEYKNNEIFNNITAQIISTVKWADSIHYLIQQAAKAGKAMAFIEIGHSTMLTGLVSKIKLEVPITQTVHTSVIASEKASYPQIHFANAQEQVDNWNAHHGIGTKAKSLSMDYLDLQTRTKAVVLFGHRAAIYMVSYNGYFDLNEVTAI